MKSNQTFIKLLIVMCLCLFCGQAQAQLNVVFSEGFEKINPAAVTTHYSASVSNLSNYSTQEGWKGVNLYGSATPTSIRIGKGAESGWVRTPSFDMSAAGVYELHVNVGMYETKVTGSNPEVNKSVDCYIDLLVDENIVHRDTISADSLFSIGETKKVKAFMLPLQNGAANASVRFSTPSAEGDNKGPHQLVLGQLKVVHIPSHPFYVVEDTAALMEFSNVAGASPISKSFTIQGYNLSENINISVEGTDATFFNVTPSQIMVTDANKINSIEVQYTASTEGQNADARVKIEVNGITKLLNLYGEVLDPNKLFSIRDIQYVPEGEDVSSRVGLKLVSTGIVGFIDETPDSSGFFMYDGADEWGGIYVYTKYNPLDSGLSVGDSIGLRGVVKEINKTTQIDCSKDSIWIASRSHPEQVAIDVKVKDVGEMYEGMLVRFDTAVVKIINAGNGCFAVGTDKVTVVVDNKFFDYDIFSGYFTMSITGYITHDEGGYRIQPRNLEDINSFYVPSGGGATSVTADKYSFNAYPNPFNDNLCIDAKEEILSVSLLSILGVEVFSVVGQKGLINISSLPAGTYILLVKYADGEQKAKVVLKR